MSEYDAPPVGRAVMFPADLFDRPSYRRLARRWPQTLDWWMRIVLVAREALFRGQLLIGRQPLTLEDLQEVDPAGIPSEFVAALVHEKWIVGDGHALAVNRWQDWYRAPSRMREAEAIRSKRRRDSNCKSATGGDRRPTVGRPQRTVKRPSPTVSDRTQPDPDPDPDPSSSSDLSGTLSVVEPRASFGREASLNGYAVSPLPGVDLSAQARAEALYQASMLDPPSSKVG